MTGITIADRIDYVAIRDRSTLRKTYMPVVMVGVKRRWLHRGFFRAEDAVAYGGRVKLRLAKWVEMEGTVA